MSLKNRFVLILIASSVGACSPVDEDLNVVQDELNRCSAGGTVEGIDVSHWNGFIDWDAVAASGRTFAFVSVGDGSFIDPRFTQNWNNAKAAGLYRGVYQYFRASGDPIAQADIVIDRVGRLGRGDLPVVLDLEELDGESGATTAARALAWMRHIEQGTGKTPILYINVSTWLAIGSPNFLASYPLWLASWGVSCPDVPSGWRTWKFHQYSATGRVPGIFGDVDLNRFNGPLSVLETAAGVGPGCVFGDGLYCGGNGVVGDPRTLYRCTGGRVTRERICALGCAIHSIGDDDACRATDVCPLGNGLYCGGDLIGGNRSTLYECTDGQVSFDQSCANACVWQPPGVDDTCI
jgi:GH25 family lysozyme M1 (1,4-beta-N-acetylmuramidase)